MSESDSFCNFYVGQKVVCIDDGSDEKYNIPREDMEYWGDLDGLTRGHVYTVRALGAWGEYATGNVWLVEIVRPLDCDYSLQFGEAPFAAARFRPVVERKTDISIFTAMLNTKNQDEFV